MNCQYIEGIKTRCRTLKCPLYNLKERGGMEALTKEFKQRVCESEDNGWLPVLEEKSRLEPLKCPIREQFDIDCLRDQSRKQPA